jgi:DNA-binding transcriptional ArsR family regulator
LGRAFKRARFSSTPTEERRCDESAFASSPFDKLADSEILSNHMVTHFQNAATSAPSPDVYRAIADPTRRAILDRLRGGPVPVNTLASDFSQSRPAISKHLRVLRQAHLVKERRCGRERRYSLEPEPLRNVAQWVEEYRLFWQTNLNNLKRRLEQGKMDV